MRKQQKAEIHAEVALAIGKQLRASMVDGMVERLQAMLDQHYTPAALDQLSEKVLGRVANDEQLIHTMRALAHDIAEDAAKAYIAHVLGWRVSIDVGRALADLEPAVPPVPPPPA